MRSLREISATLRAAVERRAIKQADLKAQAGVSQRTLTNVLSGEDDFKVSTLLALADRLGLELLLVPKGAVPAVDTPAISPPPVKSLVDAALERVRGRTNER